MKNSSTQYFLIIAFFVILFFTIKKDDWTLMVCKEKLNNAECYSNSYIIPGFKSSNACLLEGASKFKKEGFECGKNCKETDYGIRVCKEICNSSGCND